MEKLMHKDIGYESKNINDSMMMNIIIHHDGSVMKLIEILFGEALKTKCLSQEYCKNSGHGWSDPDENEEVLQRIVLLQGKDSGTHYLFATSLIRTDYLEEKIKQALLESEQGIGELIQKYKLETYREFVSSKPVSNNIVRSVFPAEDNITSRMYKLYMQGRPVMLINEYYPDNVYCSLI